MKNMSIKKFFCSAKTLQVNVNYSNTLVFTFHFIYDCQEINQTGAIKLMFFSTEILDSKV